MTTRAEATGIAVLAALLQGLPASASAEEAYIAAGGGQMTWRSTLDFHSTAGDGAWRVAAGYRFTRLLAVEACYVDFGRAHGSGTASGVELRGSASSVQVRFGTRWSDFELDAKGGPAWVVTSDHAPKIPPDGPERQREGHLETMVGLVGVWHLSPSVALRIDLDRGIGGPNFGGYGGLSYTNRGVHGASGGVMFAF